MKKKTNKFLINIVALLILVFGSFFDAYALTESSSNANNANLQSIQQAVNAAKAGDVITVPVGVYNESVSITKDNITVKCEKTLQCSVLRFDVYGSNITVDGFKIAGGKSYGVEVRQHNNTLRNLDISGVLYDFSLPKGQGAAVGIAFFGTGHVFNNIYIHDIDQYHVDDLGYTEPHQDCFISWNVPERGGAGTFITISNIICDMPQYGDSYVSKVFSVAGGAHDWTITNLLGLTPLQCIFQDDAYNINISYSTFIGAGHPTPQGCKFIKQGSTPAPHDNSITYSIFTNMSGTHAILETGNAVDSHHNCFWQVPKRTAEPGDVYADPLLMPDWSVPPNSPCAGMGASRSSQPTTIPPAVTVTPTPTNMPITSTSSPTPTFSVLPTDTPTTIPWTPTPLPQTPVITPTITANPPTLPSGTSVITSIEPDTLLVGENASVSVSLNGLPPEGIASVEFTCSYASDQVSVGSVQIGEIFGDDPVSAYNNSQIGSFVYVVAASNGKVLNTNGMAFTFSITGLQPGASSVECKAKIFRADYSMESIASVPDSITVMLFSVPTVTPLSAPMLTGQVSAKKPVTISLLNPDATLAATAMTNPDGSFNLIAPAGTFTVIASAEGHLNAQASVTLLEGTITVLNPITLPAGDIDSNNVIDQYDALTVGMNYNISASLPADLSNDGLVNAVDLVMLAENYRMAGLVDWQYP